MEDSININIVKKRKLFTFLNLFFGACVLIVISYYIFSAPFNNKDVAIHVSSSHTLKTVGQELESKNVVRSSGVFYILARIFSLNSSLQKGDYFFEKGTSVVRVAFDLSRGNHNTEPIKLTLREGLTNEEMADIFADKLPLFRKDLFLQNSESLRGQLFPDTYFFFPLTTYDELIKELNDNFKKQIKNLESDISKSKRKFDEILIMASIIELESNGVDDREMISGILWKRFDIGMPLGVDVDRGTYEGKGLPDEPLCNPGLKSIIASINPKDSPYLYYLHDDSGIIHYGKNYEEHKININKYLR